MISFEAQFEAFSDGKFISLSQSDKWMKQSNVFNKEISTTDTAIHFKKLKSQKLDMIQYVAFLEDITSTKMITLDEIKNKMASCGEPDVKITTVNGEALMKENDKKTVHIKDSTLQTLLTCKTCTSSTTSIVMQEINTELSQDNVIDVLRVQTYNRASREKFLSIFSWNRWFPILCHCFRIPRLQYPQVSSAALEDDGLKTAIATSVAKTVDEIKKTNEKIDETEINKNMSNEYLKRTKLLLWDMRSTISDTFLRIASFVLFKILSVFMSGVIVNPAHINMLKNVAQTNPNIPLIFLPLHRSHLDYIMATFILYNNEIRPPIVAAGDNLRIPFFGSLLRSLGAFYIKRKIDSVAGQKDIVYRAVLHTYIQHALKGGHNVEFFIEGGRTRTGKPCMPKSGVLSIIIDALKSEKIEDAILVPVSVNYEKLCDGNFVCEQLGEKKVPENFTKAISSIWNILNSKYGQMRMDFNKPFSLRELMKAFEKTSNLTEEAILQQQQQQQQQLMPSLYDTNVMNEDYRTLVDSIARHVVYDCATATACMTTNAVSFLLLTRFRDGDTIDILVNALNDLRKTLRGIRAISFTGDSVNIIEYAAKLLGPELISIEMRNGKRFVKPVKNVHSFIELSYYSNSLGAHFALDAVVICTLLKMAPNYCQASALDMAFQINLSDLFEACKQYCDIFQYEFVFNKPCQNLDNLVKESFKRLKEQYLFTILPGPFQPRFYDNYDSNDNISNDVTVTLPLEGHSKRIILTSILAPYTYTYMAVIRTLDNLHDHGLAESEFVKLCVEEITKQVTDGCCKFEESISTDTIRNCIKMLEKYGYIVASIMSGVRFISLHKKYNVDGVREITHRLEPIVVLLD